MWTSECEIREEGCGSAVLINWGEWMEWEEFESKVCSLGI